MSANKPSLCAVITPQHLPDSTSLRSPRSPRFHEDFDAPFSEAIVTASVSPVTAQSSASTLSYQRSSIDDSIRRISPGSSLRTSSFPQQSPTEHWHDLPWRQKSQPKLDTTITTTNHRVKGWARLSLMLKSRSLSDEPAQESVTTPVTPHTPK